ncbi:hypothetical protein TNIN_103511 [Trichonephila inaurata madagascariensis]|uniref:Uncharacterized protein n=1 Tax=Trichonephila inaurata madagascariensis TaxID=2747483 RepID=A0A8X7CPJ2_9ARAC|nr:hypothetical protein TNIN_103511 [Trichonephila inaurata madagascariensis]
MTAYFKSGSGKGGLPPKIGGSSQYFDPPYDDAGCHWGILAQKRAPTPIREKGWEKVGPGVGKSRLVVEKGGEGRWVGTWETNSELEKNSSLSGRETTCVCRSPVLPFAPPFFKHLSFYGHHHFTLGSLVRFFCFFAGSVLGGNLYRGLF